jgi:serine/threonine protein kinase
MIGERLGTWILDKELGRGGMGRVFLAHAESSPSALAAVKVLPAELAADTAFPARFQREIEILRQLDHPNIVHFLESGVHNGHSFFAMEYVHGSNLQTLLEERGKIPWQMVLDLALQIAPALKHAHDRGVIHRDLKPSNLLLAFHALPSPVSLGLVKLTDFGVASLFAGTHLTVPGHVIGTAEFLSPEQAAGKPVTRRSDLYSLGAVLYTLVTGRTPFTGTVVELLHKHLYAQFDRPSRLVPDLPPDVDALIVQMLDKDPARRPADGAVLARRLDSIRRKMDRLGNPSPGDTPLPATLSKEELKDPAGVQVGPATLMSRLMRQELENQQKGGPVQRFFNKPWVVIPLFLLTVGVIAWTFWPVSAETLYQRGAALMASENAEDWETAWTEYLGPLEKRYPDHAHQKEVAEFYQKVVGSRADREAKRKVKPADTLHLNNVLRKAIDLQKQGKKADAETLLKGLKVYFDDPMIFLRAAKNKVDELRQKDEGRAADALQKAMLDLYKDDPRAIKMFKEAD